MRIPSFSFVPTLWRGPRNQRERVDLEPKAENVTKAQQLSITVRRFAREAQLDPTQVVERLPDTTVTGDNGQISVVHHYRLLPTAVQLIAAWLTVTPGVELNPSDAAAYAKAAAVDSNTGSFINVGVNAPPAFGGGVLTDEQLAALNAALSQ